MEQLSVADTKDNEQVFKLLSDLIHANKEFAHRDTKNLP